MKINLGPINLENPKYGKEGESEKSGVNNNDPTNVSGLGNMLSKGESQYLQNDDRMEAIMKVFSNYEFGFDSLKQNSNGMKKNNNLESENISFDKYMMSMKDSNISDKNTKISSNQILKEQEKNSIDNIKQWISHRETKQVEQPDDEALIHALYHSDKIQESNGWLIVHAITEDGREFFYPPLSASFQEKKAFVDSVKDLSPDERVVIGTLIQEKFGIKPTCRPFQRFSMDLAENISAENLINAIIVDLKNNLMSSKKNDPNSIWLEDSINILNKVKEKHDLT